MRSLKWGWTVVLAGCVVNSAPREEIDPPERQPAGAGSSAAEAARSSSEAGKPPAEGALPVEAGPISALPGCPNCSSISRDFAQFTVQPGEEVLGKCQSWTLGNEEELWVAAVELSQDSGSHHANYTFVPETLFDGPDEVWACADRKYDIYTAAHAGGVLFAQSTQVKHEVQRFAPGAAIRIPPRSRIIGDVHLLNVQSAPITGRSRLTLHTLPADQVTVKLSAFHLEFGALALPPRSKSRFTGRCALAEDVTRVSGKPFSGEVYYLLPHGHELITRGFAHVMGGPNDGRLLFDVTDFEGSGNGRTIDPPIDLTGADGILFACEYLNPSEQTVNWGFGDGEMCEVFGFGTLPAFVQAVVAERTADQAGPDGIQRFSGDCINEVAPLP